MRTPVDEPVDEFREAVRRLHRAKDAAYRNAWKRRGEVLSILANIARKVDPLGYCQDGAPATADETWVDTAVDLLVYCLKYQAYMADLDAGTAVALFGGSVVRPPYSDGPAGFEAPLARADLASFASLRQPAGEAARCVASRFAELEACFPGTSSTQPVPVRLGRLAELTDAALVEALRREQAQAYARFTAACLAMEGGTADA